MLRCSSKRAFSSTRQTLCLPASAAWMSAGTSGDSSDVRYTVVLIVATFGSRADMRTKVSKLVENDSYGWCTRMSPRRISSKTLRSPFTTGRKRELVTGTQGSSLRSGRSMPAISVASARSRRPWTGYTSAGATSRPSRSRASSDSDIDEETSRRTTSPKGRRRSSSWMASSRSSASSETSKSASRVTRNAARSAISMPGKSQWRKCAMSASIGTSAPRLPTSTKRGSPSGTFTRPNRSSPDSASRARTASESDSGEMKGNGWPGPTPSGVSTGKIDASNLRSTSRSSFSERSSIAATRMPSSASAGKSSRFQSFDCRFVSSVMRSRIAASASFGVRPSGDRTTRPAAA